MSVTPPPPPLFPEFKTKKGNEVGCVKFVEPLLARPGSLPQESPTLGQLLLGRPREERRPQSRSCGEHHEATPQPSHRGRGHVAQPKFRAGLPYCLLLRCSLRCRPRLSLRPKGGQERRPQRTRGERAKGATSLSSKVMKIPLCLIRARALLALMGIQTQRIEGAQQSQALEVLRRTVSQRERSGALPFHNQDIRLLRRR